ncbi:RNA polymerase sigma factor [Nocardia cyriacigeorgica]|uniref:RNA polymerase sigma factor n=1 Tax=Nocardia cyriacigeorgica TaxID=135487 RepID=UPI0013CF547D|nr:sigma-70 family RNA polymerase sigma factor [Nocardia cyriacigeorgica]MBF6436428.1 sigma-70 family RNA polymerase sigma factor [Nocardia cyriacigeorgica]MBF6451997.1 sigma-70 family RNA polymerase sigma factor [Nocardia cyriacigeorgica]MBF6478016.1 sigma-70 family RNA polymerase sigma factor [Nocardia cyriacigeorgica]MBF6549166.1 sigma-70 family RNA polymerase sigma factor [Nocardia cyriacigeorgica]NEW25417.1 sigma-70 family RNA polymerase sigma factor [Nocardia cyriacigeorgica]
MTATETTTAPDDVTLVSRSKDGDVRAYEQLVLRHQGQMFRLASKMLADRAEAEDVVQEVFLAAWRRLAQLNDDAAFVGWLYRMTTNRCLNVIRARRPHVEADLDLTESPRSDIQPEHATQVNTQLEALNVALQDLTPEQRACWLLREVHGLSYEEIGDIVGANTTAVRGRIARARAQLSEVMKPWR